MLGLDYTSRGKFLTSFGITLIFLGVIFFFSYNIFLIERLERYNEKFIPEANNTADMIRNQHEDDLLKVITDNIKICPIITYILMITGFIFFIVGWFWWDKKKFSFN